MAGISIFYSIIMLKWLSFKEEYINENIKIL